MTGDFITGSSAIGLLSIVYSPNNDYKIQYQFISRSDIISANTVSLSGFPCGHYKVSVFVVEANGLPFNRSATVPRNVSVCEGI